MAWNSELLAHQIGNVGSRLFGIPTAQDRQRQQQEEAAAALSSQLPPGDPRSSILQNALQGAVGTPGFGDLYGQGMNAALAMNSPQKSDKPKEVLAWEYGYYTLGLRGEELRQWLVQIQGHSLSRVEAKRLPEDQDPIPLTNEIVRAGEMRDERYYEDMEYAWGVDDARQIRSYELEREHEEELTKKKHKMEQAHMAAGLQITRQAGINAATDPVLFAAASDVVSGNIRSQISTLNRVMDIRADWPSISGIYGDDALDRGARLGAEHAGISPKNRVKTRARIHQVLAELTLVKAQLLKGPISEKELDFLDRATSILGNFRLDPVDAKREWIKLHTEMKAFINNKLNLAARWKDLAKVGSSVADVDMYRGLIK